MEPEINRLLLLLLLLLLLFITIIIIYFSTVCNFQSMKSLLELNSLSSKFFCYITWCIISPIRRDTGRLSNETSRQILLFLRNSGLKITNWLGVRFELMFVTVFWLALYLSAVHFRGKLQHFGHMGKQKIKCQPVKTREIVGVRL